MYRLGLALRKTGRLAEARAVLKDLFLLRPDELQVRKELSMCYDNFTQYHVDIQACINMELASRIPPSRFSQMPKNSAVGIAGDAAQKKPKGWRSGEDWNLTPQTSKDNNTKAAALLHRLAEEENVADAQFNLACYHAAGIGMPINEVLAVKWYRRAAEQGHEKAMVNLALSLAAGKGCTKNETAAAKWFEKAAEQGDVRAARMIASCFADGRGVPQDHVKSVMWYTKAAKQNDTKSQFNLGICYQEGRGIAKDPHKAAKWYWRAANLGDTQAMYNLGCCYCEGFGVPEDSDKATRWFAEAASRGYAPTVADPKFPTPKSLPAPEVDSDPEGKSALQDQCAPANVKSDSQARSAPEKFAHQMGSSEKTDVKPPIRISIPKTTPLAGQTASKSDSQTSVDTSRFSEMEKKLFPGLTGEIQHKDEDEPKRGVPSSILKGLEKIQGNLAAGKEDASAVAKAQLVGKGKGMRAPEQGMRVRLAPGSKGNAVTGEAGIGTIMWVGNNCEQCHVRWDGTTRFDYSYCVGHNGFHDLCVASDAEVKCEATKPSESAESWSIEQVGQFLGGLRSVFGDKTDSYVKAFAREDIDGKTLLALTKDELQELGLSLGHRKMILDEIDKLKSKSKADARPAFSGAVVERTPVKAFGGASREGGGGESRDEADLLLRQMEAERAPGLHRLSIPGQSEGSLEMAALYGGIHPSAEHAGLPGQGDEADGGTQEVSLFKRRMMASKKASGQ